MKIVKILNKGENELPKYSTEGSAGMDLRANLENKESIYLKPLERKLIPTGIHIQLPENHEAQIRPRSGLAVKKGITVLNTPGTIDSDYTGEIKILLVNLSNDVFMVEHGERIAQMVVSEYTHVDLEEVETLQKTDRGDGGFGHTGTN